MSSRFRTVALATLVVTGGLLLALWIWWRGAKPSGPLVRVSKETTYVLGPLDSEGFVDYIEALNLLVSDGVTPENNFEVVLRTVVAPQSLREKAHREEYFRRLGMKPRPRRNYFRDFVEFHSPVDETKQKELDDEQELLLSGPWSAAKHPRGQAWLKAMGPFLDQIVEGTRRPRMYSPAIGEGEEDRTTPRLMLVLLPSLEKQGKLAGALLMRANLRIDASDLEGAWSDLQAIHRQARLVASGPTMLDALFALRRESMACAADVSVLHSGGLTAEQKRRFLSDLQKLPPLPSAIEKISTFERLNMLDMVQGLARNPEGSLEAIRMVTSMGTEMLDLSGLLSSRTDWNVALQRINEEFDRLEDAYEERNPLERERKKAALKKHFEAMVGRSKTVTVSWSEAAESRGSILAEKLFSPIMSYDSVESSARKDLRGQAQLAVTRIAFALEVYRDENGQHPKLLEQLTPKWLEAVPLDPFTGKPLAYRTDESSGFLVYSLGDNKTDDGGKTKDPEYVNDDWDDIAATGRPRK